jgi:hypothetical protein
MANEENLIYWKKGQSGNPAGRPKKSFKSINDALKKSGVTSLKKQDLIEAYELVFNSSEEDLKAIAGHKDTPYGLKLIIKELNNTKSRTRALADYRDYMFGKATENKNIEVKEVVRKIGYGDSDTP